MPNNAFYTYMSALSQRRNLGHTFFTLESPAARSLVGTQAELSTFQGLAASPSDRDKMNLES